MWTKPAVLRIVESETDERTGRQYVLEGVARGQSMQHQGIRIIVHLALGLAIIAGAFGFQFSQPDPASAATGNLQRIVYLDRDNNVWTSRTDGSGVRQLTTGGGYGNVQMTADGSRILAAGPYEGGTGIYLMSPNPSFPERSIASGRSPVWSPDGSHFAFAQESDIHIFDRNGDYVRSANAPAHTLKWSPDGQRVGFARTLLDPYGSGCAVQQLGWVNAGNGSVSTAGAMLGSFAWSGDGSELMYVSTIDGSVRAHSVVDDRTTIISTRLINPCGAPFFSTADGKHLIAARWSSGGQADLVVIDQRTREEQVYFNVPVDFPASRLPGAYISGDATGRYINLVRSFPTDIHRLDLATGEIRPIVTNDWRRVIGFSPDNDYFALLNTPSGKAQEMTIHDLVGGSQLIEDVGWIAWQPSQLNRSASVAWRRNRDREDRPVAAGEPRTWTWGPDYFDARLEAYDEGPDGYRAVRYYDKSRMEITAPTEDRTSDWYVTNGLLVRELITGEMQVGDNRFIEREPANVPVAGDGDDPDSPTYATFAAVLGEPAVEPGTEIIATINRNGEIGDGGRGGVVAGHYVEASNHTVAGVFWDYLNSTSTIWDGQQFTTGRLFEPTFFATGFPITEAYWARVRVGGSERDVLIQCFERRCLTYTPENPQGWQVEMGNVGRHYHAWRYESVDTELD